MLYVFEGPDSVGKSSISSDFSKQLAVDRPVHYWSFPGREEGTLGWAVYELHHAPKALGVNALTPTSLQLLHIAAHVDAIESRILPALDTGHTGVLDRFWWSTWVYGIVGGADRDALTAMIEVERKAWRGATPAAAFLIDREIPFALRSDELLADWHRLRDEYAKLADREQAHHSVLRIRNNGQRANAVAEAMSLLSRDGSRSAKLGSNGTDAPEFG